MLIDAHDLHEPTDERMTLVAVLHELTVAAIDLFDPDHSLDHFLQRVAVRLGCRAALCIGQGDHDEPLELLGSAGIARGSRWLRLALPVEEFDAAISPLPYPEVQARGLVRWAVPAHAARTGASAWLVLFFDCLPPYAHRPRGLLERLGTVLSAALEHRTLYSRLRAVNQRLEARVAERTAELERTNCELSERLHELHETQEQLLQAGKMAAVGTLVAGLSHELNNPMTSILLSAQRLLRTTQDGGARAGLNEIERQAHRCAHLVRTLLDFSRSKASTATPERIPIATLFDRLCELAASHAERRRVTLVRHPLPPDMPDLLVSPQDVETALLNLITNAIDASPPEGVVALEARCRLRQGTFGVQLSVRDDGPGIAPEVLPRIFDAFFTTKPVGQGTGLGLSLARRIIDAHTGAIEVVTARDRGTTMQVWLPAAPAELLSGQAGAA